MTAVTCPTCNGSGVLHLVWVNSRMTALHDSVPVPCDRCLGRGWVHVSMAVN